MDQTVYLPPMPGDVVFMTGNSVIKSGQKVTLKTHSQFTHVAIMTGTTQICEAMIKKQVAAYDFVQWSESRYKQNPRETRIVLRKRSLDLTTYIIPFNRAVGYYLNEDYSLSVLFSDRPVVGKSICSSLVLKILQRAGIFTSSKRVMSAPTPGTLFRMLRAGGFEVIDYSVFERSAYGAVPVFDAMAAHRADLVLYKLQSERAKLVDKFVGWSSVVESDLAENRIPLTLRYIYPFYANAFEVINESVRFACGYTSEMTDVINKGAPNWQKHFHEEVDFQIERLRQGALEHIHFADVFLKNTVRILNDCFGVDERARRPLLLLLKDTDVSDDEALAFLQYFILGYVMGVSPEEVGPENFELKCPFDSCDLPPGVLSKDNAARYVEFYRALSFVLVSAAIKLKRDNPRLGTALHERRPQMASFFAKVSDRGDQESKELHSNVLLYIDFLRTVF